METKDGKRYYLSLIDKEYVPAPILGYLVKESGVLSVNPGNGVESYILPGVFCFGAFDEERFQSPLGYRFCSEARASILDMYYKSEVFVVNPTKLQKLRKEVAELISDGELQFTIVSDDSFGRILKRAMRKEVW